MSILKKIGFLLIIIGVALGFVSVYIQIPEIPKLVAVSFLIGSGIVLIFVSKLKMWKE